MARNTQEQQIDIVGTTEATTTTARRTRRYNLDRAQREFVTSRMGPTYIEQMRKNIDAMQRLADSGDSSVLPVEVARSMASQFERELAAADVILTQLTEGTLSGADDDASED
jgi:hypothetical protein